MIMVAMFVLSYVMHMFKQILLQHRCLRSLRYLTRGQILSVNTQLPKQDFLGMAAIYARSPAYMHEAVHDQSDNYPKKRG